MHGEKRSKNSHGYRWISSNTNTFTNTSKNKLKYKCKYSQILLIAL